MVPVGGLGGEGARVDVMEGVDVPGVYQVSREFHDIGKSGAGLVEGLGEGLEGSICLGWKSPNPRMEPFSDLAFCPETKAQSPARVA